MLTWQLKGSPTILSPAREYRDVEMQHCCFGWSGLLLTCFVESDVLQASNVECEFRKTFSSSISSTYIVVPLFKLKICNKSIIPVGLSYILNKYMYN